MPLDKNASEMVEGNELLHLPSKAANAGGVVVSNFERTQNASYQSYSCDLVDSNLTEVMKNIHDNCVRFGDENKKYINYRKGANLYSFNKLYQTTKVLRL